MIEIQCGLREIRTAEGLWAEAARMSYAGIGVAGAVIDQRPTVVVHINDEAREQGVEAKAIILAAGKVLGGGGAGSSRLAITAGRDEALLDEAVGAALGAAWQAKNEIEKRQEGGK